MKLRSSLTINLIALLAIAAAFPCTLIASECKSINADQTATLVTPASTIGTITHGGFLNGSTADTFTSSLTATPDLKTFSFTDTLTITTKAGTLTDSDVTIYNLSSNVFAAISQVSSGTGELAGATGTLFISGASADGINFIDKIVGQVCLSR